MKYTRLPLYIPYSNAYISKAPGKYNKALIFIAAAVPMNIIDII